MTDELSQPLVIAARSGDMGAIQAAVEKDRNVLKQCDNEYRTVMWYAAQSGHLELVKYLAEQEKKLVTTCCMEGISPLDAAADRGHAAVVKFLVTAEPKMAAISDPDGGHPLLSAVNSGSLECVEAIFPHADLKQRNSIGENNMLHLAVGNRNVPIVEFLARNHPSYCTEQNAVGNTALHLAVDVGDIEVAKVVVRYTPKEAFSIVNANGQTARDMAKPGSEVALLVEEQIAP